MASKAEPILYIDFFCLGLPDANTSIEHSYLSVKWHCVEDNRSSQASVWRKITVWNVLAIVCDYKKTPNIQVIN